MIKKACPEQIEVIDLCEEEDAALEIAPNIH